MFIEEKQQKEKLEPELHYYKQGILCAGSFQLISFGSFTCVLKVSEYSMVRAKIYSWICMKVKKCIPAELHRVSLWENKGKKKRKERM